MATLWQDLRVTLRALRRSPAFALAAIATLGLGIGASTAIFSVTYGVSLRSLPYPDPDRLIRIFEANPANGQPKQNVSMATFHAWREGTPAIESMALYSSVGTRELAGIEQPSITRVSVTPSFFQVLAARPILGAGFKSETEYTIFTASDEAMLSYGAWQRLFGGNPDVIGERLEVAGVAGNDYWRIVGVMPEDFAYGQRVDIWQPQVVQLPRGLRVRGWRYDRVVARLRPEATLAQARAQLEAVAAGLAREFPSVHGGWTVTVESLHDAVVGEFGRVTWLLLAAVAVVLMVSCMNVGGLLVARAVARERDTAVRVALGADWRRLFRLWLTEASVICAPGAGLGILLASTSVSVLKATAPSGIPRLDAIALDLPTLAVALLATGLAVVILTLAPLGRATKQQLTDRLHSGSGGAGEGRGRHTTRAALLAAQSAGAVALVVVAMLLTRSFVKLTTLDLGWDAAGVLSLTLSPPTPPGPRQTMYRYVELADRLTSQLEATPGLDRAAVTNHVPLTESYAATLARGRGSTAGDDERWPGVVHSVGNGYFDVMQLRVVDGRIFGPTDRLSEEELLSGTTDRAVAIVSETTARTLWPAGRALGQLLWLPDADRAPWREVVGIVEDMQFHAVGEPPALHVFAPWSQYPTGRPRLVVKGPGAATDLIATVRNVVEQVEPGTRVSQLTPLDTLVARATAQPRFTSRLVAAFGVLALALAAIGIYGTLAYLVGARTREIGIRIALGAPRRRVASDVIRRGLSPTLLGGLVGLGIAATIARSFEALLLDLEPLDPASFVAGGALLLLVALAAALGPARRATRVDPAVALRSE